MGYLTAITKESADFKNQDKILSMIYRQGKNQKTSSQFASDGPVSGYVGMENFTAILYKDSKEPEHKPPLQTVVTSSNHAWKKNRRILFMFTFISFAFFSFSVSMY